MINIEDELKKKNILDLQFQKYLNISSTSIIVAFTYLIGVGIALLTERISYNKVSISALAIISIGLLGACAIFFFNSLYHLKNIPRVVKDL